MEMVALKEMVWRKKRKGERREGKGKTCFLAIFFLRNCG
jgi:hypothetical protein